MSPGNPCVLGSEGQGHEAEKKQYCGVFLHSCECWLILICSLFNYFADAVNVKNCFYKMKRMQGCCCSEKKVGCMFISHYYAIGRVEWIYHGVLSHGSAPGELTPRLSFRS